MATLFFMGIPVAFLVYFTVVYFRWTNSAEPGASFARDYWYTDRNPLHRAWWPLIAAIGYLVLVVIYGVFAQ